MTLTADELALVRDWVSDITPPTDDDLNAIYDRVGTLKGVVVSVLRKRLATLQAEPTQFSVGGEYSQSTATNISSIERQLRDIESYSDDLSSGAGGGVPVRQIVRRGSRR